MAVLLVNVIAVMITAAGVFFAVNPEMARSVLAFMEKDNRIYILASVRMISGAIFIAASPQCRHVWVIFIFGVIIFIGGSLIFIMKPYKIKNIMAWFRAKSALYLRVMALAASIIGALLALSA